MRDYGKVYSTFWSSETTGGLSDDGKILALYLMTCSHSTIAGVFRLPDGYVSEDLGWVTERVREGFAELFAKGFANRCETTKWVWVRKHLEWNKPENPNQRKSAAKIAAGIPRDCCWGPEFSRTCSEILELEPRSDWNPCATVSEPFRNQEQEQKQEQKTEHPPAPKGDELSGFADFWSSWPKTHRKGGKAECERVWRQQKLEAQSAAIVAHVVAMAKTEGWTKQGGEFVPAPVVYLRGKRWDGAEIAGGYVANDDVFAGAR